MMRTKSVARLIIVAMILQLFVMPFRPALAEAAPEARVLLPRAQWKEEETLRSSNARHFRAGDYMVAELHATPIHAQDSRGRWQSVDPTLRPTSDGAYTVDTGNYKASFTTKPETNEITFDLGKGRKVGLQIGGAKGADAGPSRGKSAFGASAAGNKIKYTDKNGLVDYEYETGELGVKETITLRKYPGVSEFFLPISIEGLDIRHDGNGGYSLIDRETHEVRSVITPPMVVDAAGQGTSGIRQWLVDQGDGPGIVISIDEDWLTAPERKYPVVIDPSVVIAPEGADLMAATIMAPSSGQVNAMTVYKRSASDERATLLKFSLTSVPQGAQIYQATLDVSRPIVSGPIGVYDVKTEWYPPMVTWTSPRGQGTTWTPGGDIGTTNYGNLTAGPVTLTPLVQEWVNRTRTNNGILLRNDQVSGSMTNLYSPTLQIIYALDVVAPSASITGLTDGIPVMNPFSIQVSATDLAPGDVGRVTLLVDGTVAETVQTPTADVTTFTIDPRRFGPGVHTIAAQVVDFAGNQATTTPIQYQAAIPPAPSSLEGSGTDPGVTLTWDRPVTEETLTYRVYRSGSLNMAPPQSDLIATNLAGTTYFDVLSGPRSESYYYHVSAVNEAGAEGPVTFVRVDFPLTPGTPHVVALNNNNQFQVEWEPSPRPGVTYNLYRGGVTGFTPTSENRIATGLTNTEFVDGINYLLNGSFEVGTVNALTGWTPLNWYPHSSALESTEAKFGTRSVKMWQSVPNQYNTSMYASTQRPIRGPATISGWSKAENVSGVPDSKYSLTITYYDEAWETFLGTTWLNFSVGTHDWEQKSITFPGHGSAPYQMRVHAHFQGPHTGTVWFDGIQVEQGSKATNYSEGLPAGTTPVYVVTAVDGSAPGVSVESKPSPESNLKLQAPAFAVTPNFQGLGGGLVLASWQPSPEPEVTYNVYRAANTSTPPLRESLIASGVNGTSYLDGINRLPNSGFESVGSGGYPNIWSRSCSDVCPQTDLGGHSSSLSLRLSRSSTNYPSTQVTQWLYPDQRTATPVTLSGYSRAEHVSDGSSGDYALVATFYDSSGVQLGSATVDFAAGNPGWERKSATFVPARPISSVYVSVVLGGSRTGTVWFDNIQLEEGSAATHWREGMPINSYQYYLVRAVNSNGVESQNTNWQYVNNRGGVITPHDVGALSLGNSLAEVTWTPTQGYRYVVERATVAASGTLGSYRPIATDLTNGLYRGGRNLLGNGGFEDDDNYNNVPDGWTYTGSFTWHQLKYQGLRSAFLSRSDSTSPVSQLTRDVPLNQSVASPLTLSGMIESSGCIKGGPSQDFGLRLELYDSASALVGSGVAAGPSGCSNWQKISVTVTPAAPAKTARVTLLIGGVVSGSAFFDAVQLEAGTTATAFQDDAMVEDTKYSYRVVPVDPLNSYGAPSQAVTIKASGAPMPVTGLVARSEADGRVALRWTESSTPNVTYSVYRTTTSREVTPADLVTSGLPTNTFEDSANLLANSGFNNDLDHDNLPDGWTTIRDTTGLLVTDGASAHGTSLKIIRSDTSAPVQGIRSTLALRQSQPHPVTLSSWANTTGLTGGSPTDATVTVHLLGFDGQEVGSALLPYARGLDWHRLTTSITPTAAIKTAVVEVALKGSAKGTVLFDSIQLQPGTEVTDWVDGPVTPGRQYFYRVSVVTSAGRETIAAQGVSAISRSWTLSGPTGDAPGAGLDDRWAFVDMAVPGGTGYLNVNTGNLVITTTDSVAPGPRLAQVFRRTYNSTTSTSSGTLGTGGWTLNIAQRLMPDATSGEVTLHEGDGGQIRFTPKPDGTYTAPPSIWMTLTKATGTYAWKIARRDGIVYEFDTQGRIRRFSEPNGNAILYDYDASGRIYRVRGPATLTATLTYDATGRVTRITDAAGKETAYAYDSAGHLTKVTDPLGVSVTYTYGADGRLASLTDGAGRQVLLTYDDDGRLATHNWTRVNGGTTVAYSETDEVHRTSIANGLNQTTELVTNAVGNLVEARDALGNTTLYDYDDGQRLVQVVSPRGLVTEIKYEEGAVTPRISQTIRHAEEAVITTYGDYSPYDKPGRMTDPTGLTTLTTFDTAGNPRTVTTAAGTHAAATTTYTYTATGMPLTVTDALGQQTTYQTDELGRVTDITNPLGGKSTMAYDQAGSLVSETDPHGNTTHHVYDALGRRTQTANPDGGLAAWRYDTSGLLVEAVAPGNIRTTYQYDGAGRLTATADGLGNTTRHAYDDAWNPILTFLPNGSLARVQYDEVGRVVREYSGEYLTDAGTPISGAPYTEYTYDAAGNVIRTRLPNGYEASAEYDLLNRTTKVTKPPNTVTYTYDKAGRMLGVKDGAGNWTRYQYDLAGNLAQVYDAANLTANGEPRPGAQFTAYSYDKLGRHISVTNPLGHTTVYQYNALGQVTRETDPIGQMTLSFYDPAGQMLTRMDRNGNMTDYEYDAIGRVVSVRYQDDWRGVKYTYDAGGRRTSMTDRTGITYYRYDARGQLVEEASPNGTLSYEYDAAGLRTALHLAEGSVRYVYDRANRIRQVTGVNGAVSTFRYGSAGEVLEVKLPGNVTQTNTYDSATNRLTTRKYTHTSGRLLSFTYGYDPVGNVTSIATQDTWEGTRNTQVKYEYDQLYRLLYEYSAGLNGNKYAGYSYDAHGNRVREETGTYTLSGTSYSRTVTDYTVHQYSPASWLLRSTKYNSSNSLLSETEYAYDGEGNLLMSLVPNRIERYTYDAANRLIRAQVNNKFTYNSYDGDGRRVQRRVVDVSTDINYVLYENTTSSSHYQYDGLFVVAERDGANALRVAYARTDGGRLLSWYRPQQTGETGGAYLVDHLGSVAKMTGGSNGAAVNQYDYDAFGKVTTLAEGVPNDMKFTGALLDSSGLYHLSARFYQASTGRFITQDTYKGSVWEPWTQNLYVYVGNNPINYIDPTGHMCEQAQANLEGGCADLSDGTFVAPNPVANGVAAPDPIPDATAASDLASSAESGVYYSSNYKDLGQGWTVRKDPPHGTDPSAQPHVHVFDPKGNEVGSWNKDGSVHDKGKPKGKVSGWVKDEVKKKTGIAIPAKMVETDEPVPSTPGLPVLPLPMSPVIPSLPTLPFPIPIFL